jgi:hypothetical protein
MPVTPFHFGPGALIKALMPGGFSWTVFALANVLIDLEPIGLFVFTGDPAHPWLHTLPGALLVATAAVAGRPLCEAWLRFWNRRLSAPQARWLGVVPGITAVQAWAGALLGTLSHLALDALMHPDVRPLWPFVPDNPWRGAVALDVLHWSCIAAGVVALVFGVVNRVRGAQR